MRFAVIATGQSLTDEQVEQVRNIPCVAVSNAYQKAPWAMALVSADRKWWEQYKPDFPGLKYSLANVPDVEQVKDLLMGSNSGLLGMEIAVRLGATSIIMLGFDLHGTHYFGPHPNPLRNTTAARFEAFKKQIASFRKVPVYNCTPGSALTCFPMLSIQCALSLP